MTTIITPEQTGKLKKMMTKLMPNITSSIITSGSDCRVHIFNPNGEFIYSMYYYQYCLEILAFKVAKADRAEYLRIVNEYFNLKASVGTSLIDYLYNLTFKNEVPETGLTTKQIATAIS